MRALLQDYRDGFEEARQAAVLARREAEQIRATMEQQQEAAAPHDERLRDAFAQLLGVAQTAPAAAPAPAAAAPQRPPAAARRPSPPEPPKREPRPGFDDAAEPMAVLDLKGHFREINPAFAKLVGYQEHEFQRVVWPSVHDRGVYKQQLEQLSQLAAGEIDEVAVQSTYLHGQGLMVLVTGRLRLERDADGTPLRLTLAS
jgi:PAS domain S-box-containing protein